jgi:hypothetical protein
MTPGADVVDAVVSLPIYAVILESEDETPGERFVRLDQAGRAGIRAGFEAGFAFLEIREDELWRDGGYVSWRHYCETFQETSRSYISRLIDHALISRELQESKPPCGAWGKPILPLAESQSRPLKKLLKPKERARAWRLAVKRAEGSPTSKIVTAVVAEILGNAAVKAGPSRGEQRLVLQQQLQKAAEAAESWDLVRELVSQLIALK